MSQKMFLDISMSVFILNYFGYNSFSVERLLNENKEQFLNVLRIADSDIVKIDSRRENKVLSTAVIDPADNQILSVEDIQKPQLVITTYHRNNPDVPFNFLQKSLMEHSVYSV